jgi:Zn-dependent peptidase ImmA (M78 family)
MVCKGTEYENLAYEYFSKLIKEKYFGFSEEQCKLTKQKPFYSKDREKNIFFDLVFETFLPHQQDPFTIHIIECKNYTNKVKIDDIEEFASKIDQIRSLKIHPIFITTIGFQEGCLNFAKNRGITLWRVISTQSHEIILNRQKKRIKNITEEIKAALTQENYDDWQFGNTFIQTPNKLTLYPKEFINDIIHANKKLSISFLSSNRKPNTPYLSKKQLSCSAQEFYNQYKTKDHKLDIYKILNKLNIKVKITEEIKNKDVIAEINFTKKEITLFGKNIFSDTQYFFALAHEIGHFYLNHDKYLITEQKTDVNSTNIVPIGINFNINRMEFQANYFAACLVLPKIFLTQIFIELLKENNILYRGFSALYIDDQPCNLENYRKICLPLCNYFNVSQETLKIRLTELGLATFNREFDQQSEISTKNLYRF